jgi:hypothetical protein
MIVRSRRKVWTLIRRVKGQKMAEKTLAFRSVRPCGPAADRGEAQIWPSFIYIYYRKP